MVSSLLAGLLARIGVAAEADSNYQELKAQVEAGEATEYRVEDTILVREGGQVVVPHDNSFRTLLLARGP